ncbi:hypothetical protein COO60DRAFT_230503 [Scenedesmus sp. NREL 46B-D3]|nr:hypothetical protein COO60DRAFT_230503 [Scenedesmus sp. NREL 46B-D3]
MRPAASCTQGRSAPAIAYTWPLPGLHCTAKHVDKVAPPLTRVTLQTLYNITEHQHPAHPSTAQCRHHAHSAQPHLRCKAAVPVLRSTTTQELHANTQAHSTPANTCAQGRACQPHSIVRARQHARHCGVQPSTGAWSMRLDIRCVRYGVLADGCHFPGAARTAAPQRSQQPRRPAGVPPGVRCANQCTHNTPCVQQMPCNKLPQTDGSTAQLQCNRRAGRHTAHQLRVLRDTGRSHLCAQAPQLSSYKQGPTQPKPSPMRMQKHAASS